MKKLTHFYIDDVIWVFRDLTRQRPASIFDNFFLKVLKEAHDKYGLKAQLNVFYRTDFYYGMDDFSLADMTDAYKAEFEAASDWLKMGFHSRQEFPDYPWVNAKYEDVKQVFEDIRREVTRFAGENSFTYAVNPHWLPMSKAGVQALYDCGVRLMSVTLGTPHEYSGDPTTLPYGHAQRLLSNRQPETRLFTRDTLDASIASSICGYNHMSGDVEEIVKNTLTSYPDGEIGMNFTKFGGGIILNLSDLATLDQEFAPLLGNEYIGYCTHEQYSYPDYFGYEPDHGDKILKAAEIMHANGYTYFFYD